MILGQQQGSPGAEQLLGSTGGQAVGWFILPQKKYSWFLQSAGKPQTGMVMQHRSGDAGWGAASSSQTAPWRREGGKGILYWEI